MEMTMCILMEGSEWITMYQSTQCHIPEDMNIHQHRFEDFISPLSHISSHRGVCGTIFSRSGFCRQ